MSSLLIRRGPAYALGLLIVLLLASSAIAGGLGIPLHPGDAMSSAIQPAGDEDPYVFDAAAGSALDAAVSSRTGLLPSIRVLDPSGGELSLPGSSESSKKAGFKRLVLSETGRYTLLVSGRDGTTGEYQLKTKMKTSSGEAGSGRSLGAGETATLTIGGTGDSMLVLSVRSRTKGATLEVTNVLNPAGETLVGFRSDLKTSASGVKGTVYLSGTFGDYSVVLGNATADVSYDVKLKVRFPKLKSARKTVGAAEPSVTTVYSTASGMPYGNPGTEVSIEGEGFSTSGAVEVWFGAVRAATVAGKSSTRLTVNAPAGEGAVDVVVVNPDGNLCAMSKAFTYVAMAPGIAALNPAIGPVAGGTTVTISGSRLADVVKVWVGASEVLPTAVDVSSVTFVTPAATGGLASIRVVDVFGQVSPSMSFRYVPAPSLDALDPAGGCGGGGTSVVAHGPDMDQVSEVWLAGSLLSSAFVAPDGVRFTTPLHSDGFVALRLVDRFGQETTFDDAFEYSEGCFVASDDTALPPDSASDFYRGEAVRIADVDGDDDLDILIVRETKNGGERLLKLMKNDGSGTFTPDAAGAPGTRSSIGDYLQGASLALGDLDGDGDLDLVVTTESKFSNPDQVTYGSYPQVHAFGTPYPSTRVFLNSGTGRFTISDGAMPNGRGMGEDLLQGNTVALGDLDGDGDLDLVLSSRKQPATTTFTDTSKGGYYYYYYPVTRNFSTEYAAPTSSATRVLLNDGAGRFVNVTSKNMPAPSSGDLLAADQVVLADVDGDGDLDMVLTIESSSARDAKAPEFVNGTKIGTVSKTRVLINDGTGTFKNETKGFMPPVPAYDDWSGTGVALGDLDGDALPDLVVTTSRELSYFDAPLPDRKHRLSRTRVFHGTGKGFEPVTPDWMPAIRLDGKGEQYEGASVELADWNHDGLLDLVITTPNGQSGLDPKTGEYTLKASSTRILLNTGTGFEDVTTRRLPNPNYSGDDYRAHALALGDVDGDGGLDLFLTTTLEISTPSRLFHFR